MFVGYAFQIEMKFKAWKRGLKLKKYPSYSQTEQGSVQNERIYHKRGRFWRYQTSIKRK